MCWTFPKFTGIYITIQNIYNLYNIWLNLFAYFPNKRQKGGDTKVKMTSIHRRLLQLTGACLISDYL